MQVQPNPLNSQDQPEDQQYIDDFQQFNTANPDENNITLLTAHQNKIVNLPALEDLAQKQNSSTDKMIMNNDRNNLNNQLKVNPFIYDEKQVTQLNKITEIEEQNKPQSIQQKYMTQIDQKIQRKQDGNQQVKEKETKKTQQQQDKESKIKQTINKIRQNIAVSKQSIVNDIYSINQYYQENQKQIKNQHHEGIKIKLPNLHNLNQSQKNVHQEIRKRNSENPYDLNSKIQSKIEKEKSQNKNRQKIMQKINQQLQTQKMREEERRRNKQIYIQQKQAKKQQEMIQKSQSKLKKNQIEKRIIYQQKFISRKSGSPEIPITNEQIKAFQDAFIQQIKERLNIGKPKNKAVSLNKSNPIQPLKQNQKLHRKISLNKKKLYQDQKFKQKLYINLKLQIKDELEPTYQSIVTDSKQIQNSPELQTKNRSHQSAPHLFLPKISAQNEQTKTFYSKDNVRRPKVQILKL